MATFNEHVLEEAGRRGDKLLVDDLVDLIERYDRTDETGVSVDRVVAYAEQLETEGAPIEPDKVEPAVEERLTETTHWTTDATASGSWFGSGALYDVGDGRVSTVPAHWHDELDGETDLTRYLEVIFDDVHDESDAFDSGGPGHGVPESLLLDAATVIGGLSREEAAEQLSDLYEAGVVDESADQQPNSRVQFTAKYSSEY